MERIQVPSCQLTLTPLSSQTGRERTPRNGQAFESTLLISGTSAYLYWRHPERRPTTPKVCLFYGARRACCKICSLPQYSMFTQSAEIYNRISHKLLYFSLSMRSITYDCTIKFLSFKWNERRMNLLAPRRPLYGFYFLRGNKKRCSSSPRLLANRLALTTCATLPRHFYGSSLILHTWDYFVSLSASSATCLFPVSSLVCGPIVNILFPL